jgi:hypothetical protein
MSNDETDDYNDNDTDYNLDTNPDPGTDLSNPVTPIEPIEAPAPVSLPTPDYSTSFCRARTTEPTIGSFVNRLFGSMDTGGVPGFAFFACFACIGLIALLVILWYSVKYSDLVKPFMSGGLKLLWYLFIYFLIISVLVLFIQFLYYFAYWFEITIHYFNLFINPLLNDRVSSLCCLFSDYVNWLIYYPAMIFYFFCLVMVVLFDVLILIPVLVFFGFLIGFLFSLLGDRETTAKGLMGQISSAMNDASVSGMFSQGLQKMKDSTEGITKHFKAPPTGQSVQPEVK